MGRTSKATQLQQAEAALQLQLEGYSMREIASTLGISAATVCRRIEEYKDQIEPIPSREVMRQVDAQRLEKLIGALWHNAMTGEDPKIINAFIRTIESRRKLWGLDMAPEQADESDQVKHELFEVIDGIRDEEAS